MFSKVLALAALAVSAVHASDVYATFYNQEGAITPNFDVSNTGCFSVDNAESVTFSQYDGSHFNGPYCLHAWADGGCPGSPAATEQFSGLNAGTKYALNQGLIYQGSYMWTPNAC